MIRQDMTGYTMIQVVNLARARELSDIYLAALYECCFLPTATLLDGVTRHGMSARLDPIDTRICLDARESLAGAACTLYIRLLELAANKVCFTCGERGKNPWLTLPLCSIARHRPLALRMFRGHVADTFCKDCAQRFDAQLAATWQDVREGLERYLKPTS